MDQTIRAISLFLPFAILVESACHHQPPVDSLPTTEDQIVEPLDLERVVVLGASVSGGFLSPGVAGLIDRSIEGPHEVLDAAEVFHFKDPVGRGRGQVRAAIEFEPTTVVALDFLFWYVYGSWMSLDTRLHFLTVGLETLDQLDAAILLGDVPDMSCAESWWLSPASIPEPHEIEAINQRIAGWARDRDHVHVLPLSEWNGPLLEDGWLQVAPGGPQIHSSELMNPDGLHPNRYGVIYLLMRVEDAIRERWRDPPRPDLELPRLPLWMRRPSRLTGR